MLIFTFCLFFQVLWAFSIYLEAVAIVPQLYMISTTGYLEPYLKHYIFTLGMYRLFYIFNWMYKSQYEGSYDAIAIVGGCVQVLLYCDFFYLYITKGKCVFYE